jgi:hypothetical protein
MSLLAVPRPTRKLEICLNLGPTHGLQSNLVRRDDPVNGEIIITAISQSVTLNYQVIDGQLVLNWAQGTLMSADTVNGTYTWVNGASSPYTNSMPGVQQYFRVLVQ